MIELVRNKMKLKLVLSLIILLSACDYEKDAIELNTEVIIDVIDMDKYLINLVENHPDRQVKIYKTQSRYNSKVPQYALYVYRKRGDNRVSFEFGLGDEYNKTAYKWVNDSTLEFRMFNTINNVSAHYTYSTHGTSFSLRTDSVNYVPMN